MVGRLQSNRIARQRASSRGLAAMRAAACPAVRLEYRPMPSLVVRTALEDRFLQANLAGYADYAPRVRYRLVPGLW